MQVVPLNRIPKTWERIPDGYTYYEGADNMYVYKDGGAGVPVHFDEDEDNVDGSRDFKAEPPTSSYPYLKLTKRGEGVDVVAYQLPKEYIFRSHSQGISYGDITSEDKLAEVLSYREAKPKRKPAKKKKR